MDLNQAALTNFLQWWLRQLSELLPPGLSFAPKKRPDALVIDIEAGRVALSLRREGQLSRIADASGSDDGIRSLAAAIQALTEPPPILLFRVPQTMQLRKLSSFPLAARRDLDSVLSYEMDRETPFGRGEVYWTYIIRRQDAAAARIDVELFIIPRAGVDPVIDACRRAGLNPSAVEIDAGADDVKLIPLGPTERWKWLRSRRPLVRWAAAAAGALLVLLAAPFIVQQISIALADSAIEALTAQAREAAALRQTLDQTGRARELVKKERERDGGILEVLAATTRLVPDDSHLTALSLRSGRLTIAGQSPSAAHLVGLLAGSPAFREPTFDAPVVQDDSSGLETFTISASLSADGLARQIAAPGDPEVKTETAPATSMAKTPRHPQPIARPATDATPAPATDDGNDAGDKGDPGDKGDEDGAGGTGADK